VRRRRRAAVATLMRFLLLLIARGRLTRLERWLTRQSMSGAWMTDQIKRGRV
jgi:hypothetical protein